MSRSRTYNKRKTRSGSWEQYRPSRATYVQAGSCGFTGRCDDVVGNREGENNFQQDTWCRSASTMSGKQYDTLGRLQMEAVHVPMYLTSTSEAPNPYGPFTYPNFTEGTPKWIALMNPSVPAVLLPAILGELRDFPQMVTQIPDLIRAWGRRLLSGNPVTRQAAGRAVRDAFRDAGSAHLGVEFGWSPFLRDLASLLGFQRELQQRLLWLLQLQAGGTIKRRLQLPSQRILQEVGDTYTQSQRVIVRQNQVRVFQARSWVTTRWVPLYSRMYRSASFADLYKRARGLTLGYGAWGLLMSWWELLPWSWLTDWFCNVGQRLNLVANSLMLRLASCCYCRTTQVDCYFAVTSKPSWLTVSGNDYLFRSRKERIVLSTTGLLKPTPSLPAFTGRQLGILGALFASRT